MNRKGDVVIPFEYDTESSVTYIYEPGLAILKKNKKYGVIGIKNNIIIPFEYDDIKWSDLKEFFIVKKGLELSLFSLKGKKISTYNNANVVSDFSSNYKNPNRKNLPILIRQKDNQRISTISNNINYMNGSNRVKDSMMLQTNNKFFYLDKKANIIVPLGKYDIAKPFALGRKAIVANKYRYGIIDEFGKEILPLKYDFVEQPSEYSNLAEIFVATKGKEVTILDSNVNVIGIKDIVSYINRDGYLMVSDKNNKKGIVDYKGKQTIPFEYDTLISYNRTQFIAKKENLYGYITSNNKIIKPFDYKYIYKLKGGLAFVDQNGKVGLYDEDKIRIPFEYDAIYDTWYDNLKEDRYIVVESDKVGTIDADNKVIIPLIYEALSGWVEYGPKAHFARKNGKYGLISYEGEIIIPIEYEYVSIPVKELVKVRKNGKYGVLTMTNQEILPCIYDKLIIDIPYFSKEESKLVVLDHGVWKYFNIDGKLLRDNVPYAEIIKEYDYIEKMGEPSNEGYDFHMQQYPIVKYLDEKD